MSHEGLHLHVERVIPLLSLIQKIKNCSPRNCELLGTWTWEKTFSSLRRVMVLGISFKEGCKSM